MAGVLDGRKSKDTNTFASGSCLSNQGCRIVLLTHSRGRWKRNIIVEVLSPRPWNQAN